MEGTLFLAPAEAAPILLHWMVVGVPSPTLQEAGIHALESAAVTT